MTPTVKPPAHGANATQAAQLRQPWYGRTTRAPGFGKTRHVSPREAPSGWRRGSSYEDLSRSSPTSAPRAVIIAHSRRARALASTLVGLLAVSGCSKASGPGVQQQGQAAPPPAQVGIVTVTPATIAEPYELGAQVQPFRRVEVRARVEGIIVERPFTEGSVVSKGRCSTSWTRPGTTPRIEARRRGSTTRSARSRGSSRSSPKHAVAQQDVDNARSELESAQAAVDAAKKDLDDTRDSRRDQRAGRSRAAGARRARDRARPTCSRRSTSSIRST